MKSLLIVVGVTAGALIVSPPRGFAADTTPNDESAVMKALDPDHDRTVSLDEVKAAANAKFDTLDTDREGTLDASELTGIMSPEQIKALDPDHDGTIDKAEYLKVALAQFKKADRDHDGTLDRAELSSAEGRALVAMLAY